MIYTFDSFSLCGTDTNGHTPFALCEKSDVIFDEVVSLDILTIYNNILYHHLLYLISSTDVLQLTIIY